MGERQILQWMVWIGIIWVFHLVGGNINLVTYDEAFDQCSTVDQQQIISDATCSSVNFGSGSYLVLVDCVSPTISSAWTFNLYQSSQFGCVNVRPYRLISGSSSGDGCFVAVISYTGNQYFSIRCDSSLVDTTPSIQPSLSPTAVPTFTPTIVPSYTITNIPTPIPTSPQPSISPTYFPSFSPTVIPTIRPTYPLTNVPTASPTYIPGLSYTVIYTAYAENCNMTMAPNNFSSIRRTYNSGSIPFKGNCTTVPIFVRLPINNGSVMEVINLPGRVHCYDSSNWILELYSERSCSIDATQTSLILETSSSSTGCFSRSSMSFAYNNVSINNQTILFSVSCTKVFNSQPPSVRPTVRPSFAPSTLPTFHPSTQPSISPSQLSSFLPTIRPTPIPSPRPTSSQPTVVPTAVPSPKPSLRPSVHPSFAPSRAPITPRPSISLRPTTFAPTRPTSVLAKIRFFVTDSPKVAVANIQTMPLIRSKSIITYDNDGDTSSFEGFISPAEEYSLSNLYHHIPSTPGMKAVITKSSSQAINTATTAASYPTSCTKSLSSLRELGTWTVSRGVCVSIGSLSSMSDSIVKNLNTSIASFSIMCIPRAGDTSSFLSPSSISWQVSTYATSSSCEGNVDMMYTGSSSCACGYANMTSSMPNVSLLAMMVDCDFSDASTTCDANAVSSTSNGNVFSVTTREGLQNLIGVVIAGVVVIGFLVLGMRRAWRKYLLDRGEDPDAGSPWVCSTENWWMLWDALVGKSLLHFCRYCCACVCCCCACWMAPSGSVTPRDGDDSETYDEEEGDDVFDVSHRRRERRGSVGVAAVLTMADIRMADDLSDTSSAANDLSNMTLAEAVAIRRRASTSSTTSTSTLQVTARPYDDHLDFALPMAELSTRRRRRSRRSTFRRDLFRWLLSMNQGNRSSNLNNSDNNSNYSRSGNEVGAEADVATVPPTVGTPIDSNSSSRNNSIIIPSPIVSSPRRRVELFDDISSDDDDEDNDTNNNRGRRNVDTDQDTVDAWDQVLQISASASFTSPTDISTSNRILSQTHARHHHSNNRSRTAHHPPRSSREIDYVHSSVNTSLSLPASPSRPAVRHQQASSNTTVREDTVVSTSHRNESRRRSSTDNRTRPIRATSNNNTRSSTSSSPRRTRR